MTMHMELAEIMEAFKALLLLPEYPSNTQQVERLVRVITEVADKRVGFLAARERLILQLLKSRSMVPTFNTKSDDKI